MGVVVTGSVIPAYWTHWKNRGSVTRYGERVTYSTQCVVTVWTHD